MVNKTAEWLNGFYSNIDDENPYHNLSIPGPKGITPQFEEWREGQRAFWGLLTLEIAKVLYYNDGGLDNRDFILTFGRQRKTWEQLEQHEWDDFKTPAEAVIRLLVNHGLIKIDELRVAILTGMTDVGNSETP